MSALSILDAAISAANASTVVLTDGSTVANVMNDSAAPTTSKSKSKSKSVAPILPTTTPLSTPTNVQNGVVSAATALSVPGFKIAWSTDALDAATVKAIADYKGKNPWYAVITAIAARKAGHCTITLEDGHKGSPLGTIKSARNSAMGRVKNAGKIDVRSHATEKGVWYIIREP